MRPEQLVAAQILQHSGNKQFVRVEFGLDGTRRSSAPQTSYDDAMTAPTIIELDDSMHPERHALFTPVKNILR